MPGWVGGATFPVRAYVIVDSLVEESEHYFAKVMVESAATFWKLEDSIDIAMTRL